MGEGGGSGTRREGMPVAMLACLWNSSRETQKQEHKAADSSASAANSIQTCPAGMRSGPAHVALLCERTIARSHGGGTARRRRGGRAANEPDGENGHIRGHADRGHVQRGDQLRGWQPAQGSQPSTVPRKCLSRTSIYRQRARAFGAIFWATHEFQPAYPCCLSEYIPWATHETAFSKSFSTFCRWIRRGARRLGEVGSKGPTCPPISPH